MLKYQPHSQDPKVLYKAACESPASCTCGGSSHRSGSCRALGLECCGFLLDVFKACLSLTGWPYDAPARRPLALVASTVSFMSCRSYCLVTSPSPPGHPKVTVLLTAVSMPRTLGFLLTYVPPERYIL